MIHKFNECLELVGFCVDIVQVPLSGGMTRKYKRVPTPLLHRQKLFFEIHQNLGIADVAFQAHSASGGTRRSVDGQIASLLHK